LFLNRNFFPSLVLAPANLLQRHRSISFGKFTTLVLFQELDEDVEGMQSTIYFLQQQLKEAKETIATLQQQQQQQSVGAVEQNKSEQNKSEEETVVMKETEEELVMDADEPEEAEKVNAEIEIAKQDCSTGQPEAASETVEASVEVEKSRPEEEEDLALSLRLSRRGRSTPTKSNSESPTKRGRSTRGQKREVNRITS
jgi:TolA-binding protein